MTLISEILQSYKDYADLYVPGWENLDKNALCRAYSANVENKELREGYFAAIVYAYRPKLSKYQQISPGFSATDFYDWYIRGINYILKHRPWDKKESPLYNDPVGPDKAINRVLVSSRLIFYEKYNTDKRRANICTASIDKHVESLGDTNLPSSLHTTLFDQNHLIYDIIKRYFDKKEYFAAFMLFNIIARDPFEPVLKDNVTYMQFSEKKLARYMRLLPESFCKIFADELSLPLDKVIGAAKTILALTRKNLHRAIKRYLKIFSNTECFIEMLRGE